jgi:site-specific DNA-methyltransferase (adenine-specific)
MENYEIHKTMPVSGRLLSGACIHGDCLVEMDSIPGGSVDLICADLPFGKTRNPWDTIIPMNDYVEIKKFNGKIGNASFDEYLKHRIFDPERKVNPCGIVLEWENKRKRGLWSHYWRILKPDGVVVLFGQDKFTAKVMLSDIRHRYNLIWEKTGPSNPFMAKKMPLRYHEDIMVFYKHTGTYNPQKTTGHKPVNKYTKNGNDGSNFGETKKGISGGGSTERYPKSIWKFPLDKQKEKTGPTQKPVKLIEEIIKTYSNPGEIVLDNTSGRATTGVACINTDRDFILIEKDGGEFTKGRDRLRKHLHLI